MCFAAPDASLPNKNININVSGNTNINVSVNVSISINIKRVARLPLSGVPHAAPHASLAPRGRRPARFPGPARSPPRPFSYAAHSAHPDRVTSPRTCHPIRRSPRLLRAFFKRTCPRCLANRTVRAP